MRRNQEPQSSSPDHLLGFDTVLEHVPFSKQQIRRKIADGSFPAPFKIGRQKIAWRQSDIAKWMADQIQVLPRGDSINQCAA